MLVLSLSRVTAEGVRMPLLRFVGTRRGLLMGPPPNSLDHSAVVLQGLKFKLENSHAEDSNLIVTSSMPDSDDIEEPGNVHCQLICHSEGQAQARVEKNTQVGYRGHPAVSYTPYQTPELRKNATCTPRSIVSTFPRPTTRSTTPTRAHPPIPLLPPSPISHVVIVLA